MMSAPGKAGTGVSSPTFPSRSWSPSTEQVAIATNGDRMIGVSDELG